MNINEARVNFPILSGEKTPIYFDNACMTLRPQVVIDKIVEYYRDYPACGGRSNHHLAERVSKEVDVAREKIAQFINAKKSEEIVFVKNATEAINLVAQSLELLSGDIVLGSDKEHTSNLVPWLQLVKEKGIVRKIVPSAADNTFDLEAYEKILQEGGIKLVAIVHSSNLDGVTFPAKEIIQLAHQHGALVLLDAAQSVPHHAIDVQDLDVDFLAFSGHKMLGPSGIGALYGKYELLKLLKPFITGGSTVAYTTYESFMLLDPPMKFEAGLQDYAGILGFGAAVEYLEKIGMEKISEHEIKLTTLLDQELRKLKGVHIIGPENPALRGGITSFWIDGIDVHQLSIMLDEAAGIAVRSGQHCVHSWFHARGIKNSLRVSFYLYNTEEEVKILVEQLKKIINIL